MKLWCVVKASPSLGVQFFNIVVCTFCGLHAVFHGYFAWSSFFVLC